MWVDVRLLRVRSAGSGGAWEGRKAELERSHGPSRLSTPTISLNKFPFSYNYCDGEGCDGGVPKGTCHLKALGPIVETYGCSGPRQPWRSGERERMG